MKLNKILLIGLCCSFPAYIFAFEEDDTHQIVQLEDFYPIRHHANANTVADSMSNVIVTNEFNMCNTKSVLLSPKSLNISKGEFNSLWRSLGVDGYSQEKHYIFTYRENECHRDKPVVIKVEDCTVEKCGKDFVVDESLLWVGTFEESLEKYDTPTVLPHRYIAARKSIAPFFVKPLVYDVDKKAWKFKMMHTNKPEAIALEGYVDSYDFLAGNFVKEIKGYKADGTLYTETVYSDDGTLNADVLIYYPDGKILSRERLRNNKFNGYSIDYYPNGSVKFKMKFKNNKIIEPGVYYDESGNVIEK